MIPNNQKMYKLRFKSCLFDEIIIAYTWCCYYKNMWNVNLYYGRCAYIDESNKPQGI